MRKVLVGLCAALFLISAASAKGGQKGDWEVGAYAGFTWPDDYGLLDPDNAFHYGARAGYFLTELWSLEGSWQRLSSEAAEDLIGGSRDFTVDSLRMNVLYNVRPTMKLRPFVTIGAGWEATDAEDKLDTADLGGNVGGGLRWFVTDSFGMRFDGRWVMTSVDGVLDSRQSNWEAGVGVLWTFGGGPPPDADGDGVPDRKDKCPQTPRGAVVDFQGCPGDSDFDGVFNGLDKCPETPKGWPVDAQGCPKDSDGDGVPDGADSCANTPKGASVDSKGCPIDSDGDGVYDGLDACPNTPRGARVDPRGCPTDGDGDGVYDGLDRCPDTPRGARVDNVGCPIPEPKPIAPAIFKGEKTLVLEGVTFESNSDRLTKESEGILDKVAASLSEFPDLRIEVAGHTDSQGSEAFNMKLSERRAASVKAYLVGKGVRAENLSPKGYGETAPIADNGTKEGRARNRRVALTRMN